MGLKEDIVDEVNNLIEGLFETEKVSYIPTITDTKLTFGKTGLKFNATVLYIDLRKSTEILNEHNKSTVAKIHMAYYHTIVKVVKKLDGYPRSFNGDSLLVFFLGDKIESIRKAILAANTMKHIIKNEEGIPKEISKYRELDFGIGIDIGEVLCTKVGVGGDSEYKDLIWLGNAINRATRLSDLGKEPNNVFISKQAYELLSDEDKYYSPDNFIGNFMRLPIWDWWPYDYNGSTLRGYYPNFESYID